MAMPRPRTILVIGGGLGGLAFAQILRHSKEGESYKVMLFERDASPTHREQGYLIGINQRGLSNLSSIPNVASFIVKELKDSAFSVVNNDLSLMLQRKHGPEPEDVAAFVSRWKLRNALAEGLEIQWGKRFVQYEEFDTHVVVHFEDGTQVSGDLVVGADGAKSRVRAQRCPELQLQHLPFLTSAGTVAVTPSIRARMPKLVELVEASELNCVLGPNGNTVVVMEYESQRGETRILWTYSYPPASADESLPTDPVELKRVIDSRAGNFSTEVATLLTETTPEEYVFRGKPTSIIPVKANPLGRISRVTLLGDSAHAMTTHRGLGTNITFADATDLVRALTEDTDPWQALSKYEETMFKRGFEAVIISEQGSVMLHMVGMKGIIRNIVIRTIGWVLWGKQQFLSFQKNCPRVQGC